MTLSGVLVFLFCFLLFVIVVVVFFVVIVVVVVCCCFLLFMFVLICEFYYISNIIKNYIRHVFFSQSSIDCPSIMQ